MDALGKESKQSWREKTEDKGRPLLEHQIKGVRRLVTGTGGGKESRSRGDLDPRKRWTGRKFADLGEGCCEGRVDSKKIVVSGKERTWGAASAAVREGRDLYFRVTGGGRW